MDLIIKLLSFTKKIAELFLRWSMHPVIYLFLAWHKFVFNWKSPEPIYGAGYLLKCTLETITKKKTGTNLDFYKT